MCGSAKVRAPGSELNTAHQSSTPSIALLLPAPLTRKAAPVEQLARMVARSLPRDDSLDDAFRRHAAAARQHLRGRDRDGGT